MVKSFFIVIIISYNVATILTQEVPIDGPWVQCYSCPSRELTEQARTFEDMDAAAQLNLYTLLSDCDKLDGGEYLCYSKFGCAKYFLAGRMKKTNKYIGINWRNCVHSGDNCKEENCTRCNTDLCNSSPPNGVHLITVIYSQLAALAIMFMYT